MKPGTIEAAAALLVVFTAMLDPRVSLLLALAALMALAVYRFAWPTNAPLENLGVHNALRAGSKEADVARVLKEVRERGAITNDEVEAMLGVSDATAERYLQELESRGSIVQTGKTGRTVSYKPQS